MVAGAPYYALVKEREGAPSFFPRCPSPFLVILPEITWSKVMERILSLKETCRIRAMPSFPMLVNLITCYFKEQQPELGWI